MVNNFLAVLPGMQNDVAGLITMLLLSEQQTLIQFPDIAMSEQHAALGDHENKGHW
jgi:hypothetical protein